MREHIYLHSSNLSYTEFLSEDALFEPVYMYMNNYSNTSPYEWGRIKNRR